MTEVKRYDAPSNEVWQDVEGIYVFYEDYAELKAQRDALAAEVSAIREQAEDVYAAGYNHGHLNTVDGIAYAPPVEDEFYHNALQVMLEVETPATDAYLNSVRADAVVNAAAHLGDMASGKSPSTAELIKSCGRALLTFAAQLRAGEQS